MLTSPNLLALIATLICILVNASPVPVDAVSGLRSDRGADGLHGSVEGAESILGAERHDAVVQRGVGTPLLSGSHSPSEFNVDNVADLVALQAPAGRVRVLATTSGPPTIIAPVAHVNQSYSFTITSSMLEDVTTGAPGHAPQINQGWRYAATGLPGWMTLDDATGQLSGTPSLKPNTTELRITGTVIASPPSDSTAKQANITSCIDFLVASDPALTLVRPLSTQLSNSSSVDKTQQAIIASATVLPTDASSEGLPGVSVPAGWSFSIGLLPPWAPVSSPGKTFYTAVDAKTGGPLPPWLQFKNTTLVFEGVTPSSPGQAHTIDVALVGSRYCGHPDSTQLFTISVEGQHNLQLPASGLMLDWVIGQDLNVTMDSGPGKAWWGAPSLIEHLSAAGGWTLDGKPLKDADVQALFVNTSAVPGEWLTMDSATRTIGGVPPASALNTNLTIPLSITDQYGVVAQTFAHVSFEQAAFNVSTISPVIVHANSSVSADLSSYFSTTANASAYNVSVSFVPKTASSWLAWNASNLLLSGSPPPSLNYSLVSVGYHATRLSTLATTHAWMNVTLFQADATDGGSEKTHADKALHHPTSLGHSASVALIATGASIGGIVLLCALFWYCGRYVEEEKHIVLEDGYDARRRESNASDDYRDSDLMEKDPGWFKDPAAVGERRGLGFHFEKQGDKAIASPQVAVLPFAPPGGIRTISGSWRRQIARAAKRPVTRLFISNPVPHVHGHGMDHVSRAAAPPKEESTPAGLLSSVFSPALPPVDQPSPSPTSTIFPPIRPWTDTPRSTNEVGSNSEHCPGTDFSDDSRFVDSSRASWQTGSTHDKVKERDRAAMLASRHGRPGTGTDSLDEKSMHSSWTPHCGGEQTIVRDIPTEATFRTLSSASDELGSIRTADRFNVTNELGFEGSIHSAMDAYNASSGSCNLRAPTAQPGSGVLHAVARNRFVSDTVALSQAGSGSAVSYSRSMPSVQHLADESVVYENDDIVAELETYVAYQARRVSGHSYASSSALRDALDETPTLHYTPTMRAADGQSPAHSRKSSRRGAASPLSADSRSIVGTATPTLIQYNQGSPFDDAHCM